MINGEGTSATSPSTSWSITMNDSDPAKPYCYHCGQPVEKDVSSCLACGKDLDWSTDLSRPSPIQQTSMKKKQKRLGGIFILLFPLWAGWVVLHEEKLSYERSGASWTNRDGDGYTEFEFTLRNRTAHELRVTLQATLRSYSNMEGTSPPTRELRGGRIIESKQIEVLIPAYEELLVRDRISCAHELAAKELIILDVKHKGVEISTRSRVKGTLVQLFIGGLLLTAILLGIRLLPKH
jgi:hypothetical protein